MKGQKHAGLTGFNSLIGDELGTTSDRRDPMYM